jgi:hypothetical protein
MGKLTVWSMFAVGLLAACGSDSKSNVDAKVTIKDSAIDSPPPIDAPPDAPSHDFACVGMPLPTTADANIDLSGTVNEVTLNGAAPLAGADVRLCKGNCNGQNQLGTFTSDAQGAFNFNGVATGSTPLDAYVRMTHTADRTTLVYPPLPFTATQPGIPVLTFSDSTLGLLAGVAGVTQDPTKGMLALAVVDCATTPITDSANIVFSIKQGGNDVAGTTTTDLGSIQPQAAGTFIIWNVPAGTTEVSATYMGTTMFLKHNMLVTAAATTESIVRPGP